MNDFRKIELEEIKKSLHESLKKLESLKEVEEKSLAKFPKCLADSVRCKQLQDNVWILWSSAYIIEDMLDKLDNIR